MVIGKEVIKGGDALTRRQFWNATDERGVRLDSPIKDLMRHYPIESGRPKLP